MAAERDSPELLPVGKIGEMKSYLRDDMRDYFDHELKNVNYLLVANATGLVACLAVLKDYTETGPYRGLGIFIVLFCAGLLSGIIGLVMLSQSRMGMLTWITHGGEKPKPPKVAMIPLGLSLTCLFAAIVGIGLRFYSL